MLCKAYVSLTEGMCDKEARIVVDRTKKPKKVLTDDGSVKGKFVYMYPSFRGEHCYFHHMRELGRTKHNAPFKAGKRY